MCSAERSALPLLAELATWYRDHMLKSLFLRPGPSLIRNDYNPDQDAFEQSDVTDFAAEYLFELIEPDPDLTLGDILRLIHRCEILQHVFRRDFAVELCAEAIKGPLPPSFDNDPPELKGVEYLELSRHWMLDSSENSYRDTQHLSLRGIGHALDVDAPDHGVKAGERMCWSMAFIPVREMLHLPVRVKESFEICEDDVDSVAYFSSIATARCAEVTLGQFIHCVLWDLSFHGTSENQADIVEEMLDSYAEFGEGTAQSVPADNLLDKMSRASFAAVFETLGDVPQSDVYRVIRNIPDAAMAMAHLARAFGDKVVVKPAFRELTGHAFRKAFRLASSDEI